MVSAKVLSAAISELGNPRWEPEGLTSWYLKGTLFISFEALMIFDSQILM